MKRYEVSEMRRIRDYSSLFLILKQYSARHFDYKHNGKQGTLCFTIPKADAPEMNKQLKESGLVFKVLE
jgi:predicted transcriptional regulator